VPLAKLVPLAADATTVAPFPTEGATMLSGRAARHHLALAWRSARYWVQGPSAKRVQLSTDRPMIYSAAYIES
jgi:hypothetical protein